MSPTIRLISTDFDGTLFKEFENPPVPARLQQAIAGLQSAGAKWVINTGRDLSSLMEALGRADVEVEPDYLVLVEREIYRHSGSEYRGFEAWNAGCTSAHAELFARVKPHLPRLVAAISARFPARIYEDAYSPFCLVAGHHGNTEAIHEALGEFCRSVPDLGFVCNDVYARLCHAAYSKGTALGELTRQLGLTAGQVFAAGDQMNDLPMLNRHYAHFLAAPQNALPRVKETVLRQSGYVSPLAYGHGVADALEHYLGAAPG
jgi:HAD superfamily hydrolase (TIGR01484 family)